MNKFMNKFMVKKKKFPNLMVKKNQMNQFNKPLIDFNLTSIKINIYFKIMK